MSKVEIKDNRKKLEETSDFKYSFIDDFVTINVTILIYQQVYTVRQK